MPSFNSLSIIKELSGYQDIVGATKSLMNESAFIQHQMNIIKIARSSTELITMQSSIGEKVSASMDQQAQKIAT